MCWGHAIQSDDHLHVEPMTAVVPVGTVESADPIVGEGLRMRALRASGVLATRPQEALDALARLAAALCGAPLGSINILDDVDQTSVATVGWDDAGLPTVMPRTESVCQFTIAAPREITEISDLRGDPRTAALPLSGGDTRFYAGAPVMSATGDAALGAVCVLDTETRVLTPGQRDGLRDTATVATTLIEQHGLAQRLVGVADRLGQQADTDPLTGLYNRRALEPVLANLPPRTAVAMVDLDRFKDLNDRFGHEAGDRALRGYADLFTTCLRGGDVAARWGGEEFLLVLEDPGDGRPVLNRLLERARATALTTFSAGLTVAGPAEDPVQLVARADRLLYEAKRGGRDRVVDDIG